MARLTCRTCCGQVPSFDVNAQPISDAATNTRPPNLRGLSPDNVLVLVNGKRRHRGSIISFLGGGISDGAQGVDIASIPALALKQVEVLRDGASSQYGSDAIAGVLNFILRDDAEGFEVVAHGCSTRAMVTTTTSPPTWACLWVTVVSSPPVRSGTLKVPFVP